MIKRDPKERFESFIMYAIDGCWYWMGSINEYGYGQFTPNDGRVGLVKAHRFSYEMHKGLISKDKIIMHLCDNPCCVNPDHLKEGTRTENSHDMLRKGRHRHAKPILSTSDIKHIKKSRDKIKHLSIQFGISVAHTYKVRSKKYKL